MILLFGGGGFIGSYLTEELIKENFKILVLDANALDEGYYKDQGIPFQKLDITRRMDFAEVNSEGAIAAINLACVQPCNVSEANYDPVDYIMVNVVGLLNILDFCLKNGIKKVIHVISHRNTSGLWRAGNAISEVEHRAIKFTGEYAMFSISESAAADCVEHYTQDKGIHGIVFRLPPVYGYGPHMEIFKEGKPHKTGFQIFIENAIAGKPIEVWGDPDMGRDIIYVKDVVSAFLLALKNETANGLYNIASGRLLTLREEAQTIVNVFSSERDTSLINYRPDKTNSIEPFLYDISKAKRDLGWIPQYSFHEMLLDYKAEAERGKFRYLVDKRRRMLES